MREAQARCAGFSNKDIRNKAVANAFGARIAKKFFEETGKEIDIENSLQYVEDIVAKQDISDVYVNGHYIDVRLYFNDDEICIPAQHFNDEMLPLVYMFIKLQKDFLQAEVMGFMLPDTITVMDDTIDYYPINENALIPFEEIEYLFRDAEDAYNVDDSEIYAMLDGSGVDTKDLVRKMLRSYDGRRRFIKAYRAQSLLNGIEISGTSSETIEQSAELSLTEDDEAIILDTEDSIATTDDYDFSTMVSPNLPEENSENTSEDVPDEFGTLEQDLDNMDIEPEGETSEDTENEIPAEEIETLFESEDNQEETAPTPPKQKSVLPLLILLLVLIVGGYFGYTKFAQSNGVVQNGQPEQIEEEQAVAEKASSDAMPVETVEKAQESVSKNEGNSVSIPAIEQNLDASIVVSNLRIDWEVPSGYITNTQAKRYLVKLGKIIQLNLKAELLLLHKPPITNRITVELKYNKTGNCFETVGIVASSGESVVDNLILQTVNKALETKLNISTESFEKLSGNPVLVIKL